LQGIVDAGYLNLTPGTRSGVIQDESLARLATELQPIETQLVQQIEEQRRAEEEQASRDVLRSIQRAIKEAILTLPVEEYDWFNIREEIASGRPQTEHSPEYDPLIIRESPVEPRSVQTAIKEQKQFFDYPGPLFSVRISPSAAVVAVNGEKNLRAIPRDRAQRLVESDLSFQWRIIEGEGRLEKDKAEIVTFHSASEPGLTGIGVVVNQSGVRCEAEALLTITQTFLPAPKTRDTKGIPAYTFQRAPGELWRSRHDAEKNLVVVNSGHRDFVYAARNKALKLRYICRLYSKELVLRNFAGVPAEQLLERLIELNLYTEENLK